MYLVQAYAGLGYIGIVFLGEKGAGDAVFELGEEGNQGNRGNRSNRR